MKFDEIYEDIGLYRLLPGPVIVFSGFGVAAQIEVPDKPPWVRVSE